MIVPSSYKEVRAGAAARASVPSGITPALASRFGVYALRVGVG